MALNRQWSYPAGVGSVTANDMVTRTVHDSATPGFNLGADSIQVPTLITAPPSAASVYAPASYTAQTASVATVLQNNLGYDAIFVAYFQGAASVASFQVGVGSTSPPPTVTVATSITSTTTQTWDFPLYVPAGYYYSFQATQSNSASVPSSALTIVANPV